MSDTQDFEPTFSEHSYSESEVRELQRQLRGIRRRQLLVLIVLLFAALFLIEALAGNDITGLPPAVSGVLSIAVLAVGFFYGIWNWRCPACGFFLRQGLGSLKCVRCKLPMLE